MSLTPLYCPRCRLGNPAGSRFCIDCGTPIRLPAPYPAAPFPTLPAGDPQVLTCPNCAASAGQKLTALCQAGSWSSTSRGVSMGAGHIQGGPNFGTVGVSASASVGATSLAQMLAPPPIPIPRSPTSGGLVCILIGTVPCGMGVLFLVSGGEALSVAGIIAVLVGIAFIGLGVHLQREAQSWSGRVTLENQQRRAHWERMMYIWDRLYYCPRCDSVYDPSNRQATPARGLQSYLWHAAGQG